MDTDLLLIRLYWFLQAVWLLYFTSLRKINWICTSNNYYKGKDSKAKEIMTKDDGRKTRQKREIKARDEMQRMRKANTERERESEHIYTYIHPSISASSSIVKIVQQEEEWEGVKIGTDAAEEGWRNKITNGRRGKHWKMNKGVCIPDEEGEGRRTVGGGRGWGRTGWRKKVEREGNGDEGRSMEMLEKVT